MKLIKVSVLLKFCIYLSTGVLLTISILIPSRHLSMIFLFSIIILLLHFALFYYVLKNKLLAIKLYGVYLIIAFCIPIQILYSFQSTIFGEGYGVGTEFFFYLISLYTLFPLLILLKLYFLHKDIKKGVENMNIKKITTERQTKNFLIFIVTITIFVIIFRFGYYEVDNIQKVDNSSFITKLQNTEVKDDNNLFINLRQFTFVEDDDNKRLKKDIIDCYYDNICYKGLDYYKNNINRNLNTGYKMIYYFSCR